MKEFIISFIVIIIVSQSKSDECDKCLPREECEVFGNLNLLQQKAWMQKFPCTKPQNEEYSNYYGFTAVANGDYVCCPNSALNLHSKQYTPSLQTRNKRQEYIPNNYYSNQNNYDGGTNGINPSLNYPNVPNEHTNWRSENNDNQNVYRDNNDNQNTGRRNPSFNSNVKNVAVVPPNRLQSVNRPGNALQTNNAFVAPNQYIPDGKDNSFQIGSVGGQCPITSFPPNPETGCCGREASDTDRITKPNTPRPHTGLHMQNPFAYPNWPWSPPKFPRFQTPRGQRVIRSPIKDNNITIDERIAGGRETGFVQFPWTALLRATFDYGKQKSSFECGGSLISSRYVLTAGHCVYDEDGPIIQAEVYLAEYDKTTFPRDCRIVPDIGQVCLENIVMYAEDVILHPEYNDPQLRNDIALLRLRGNVPYTDYVRPICLPSIDINTPEFSNIRLAVAGWGRNGRFRTDIKQSTIVNLVPYEQCNRFYPDLSLRQLCAAGVRGEDTCKGDSGGPLMTVYEGKYEVVGIVSGKRADAPCGNGVPSLYTNVYHYLDWIRANIKN